VSVFVLPSHRNLLHAGRTENSGRTGQTKGTGKTAAPAVEPIDEAQVKLAAKLKEYKGVWVFVEQNGGIPAEVSWELLVSAPDWPKPQCGTLHDSYRK